MRQGGAPELVASPEIKPKFPCQSDAENKVLKVLKVRSQKKSVPAPMQKHHIEKKQEYTVCHGNKL